MLCTTHLLREANTPTTFSHPFPSQNKTSYNKTPTWVSNDPRVNSRAKLRNTNIVHHSLSQSVSRSLSPATPAPAQCGWHAPKHPTKPGLPQQNRIPPPHLISKRKCPLSPAIGTTPRHTVEHAGASRSHASVGSPRGAGEEGAAGCRRRRRLSLSIRGRHRISGAGAARCDD
jgi:hypothetical protein